MKKTLTLALFCLCLLSVCGQETAIPDGVYKFSKAELFIRHYQTQEIVDHKIITDTASIQPNQDFHLENILLEMKTQYGQPIECVMLDRQRYDVDKGILQPATNSKEDKEETLMSQEDKDGYLYTERNLQPHMLEEKDETLTMTYFKYNFGQTGYDFTMQAELIVTMTKQKENETDNI